MSIQLKRVAKRDTYTIGKLYINGSYICDTIEDKDRGLAKSMTAKQILEKKVKHQTAIPTGTYDVTLKVKSPKYSNSQYFMKYCNAMMPRLLDVPGFDGVLIHTGNTAEDSSGCVILGYNTAVGKVLNSKKAFETVYPMLKKASDAGEKITITIE